MQKVSFGTDNCYCYFCSGAEITIEGAEITLEVDANMSKNNNRLSAVHLLYSN